MYKIIGLFTLLMPTLANAHAGHGEVNASSVWHWLLEFEHSGWMLLFFIVLFSLWRKHVKKFV